MKTKKHIMLILLSISLHISAQENSTWYAFFSKEGYKIGFKNVDKKIMIIPKFMGFTSAKKFNNIIGVMEESNHTISSYYLLKNGNKVGKDSLYVWDMAFDCESEGMIRFRNTKTDKVGFFNTEGKVVIPAIYTEALPFRNGIAVVYNGEKICDDGTQYDKNKPCEHWYLSTNKNTLLIDKKNKVLIKNFKYNNAIDFYSMRKNKTTELPYRSTQNGMNNNYYSFTNYKKEFLWWLKNIANHIKETQYNSKDTFIVQRLIHKSISEIYFSNMKQGTRETNKIKANKFIEGNLEYLTKTLLDIQKENIDFFISIRDLDSEIWNEPSYDKYFDDCGNALVTKYPVLSIVINQKHGEDSYQDFLSFLKTEEGF